jgi:deazaflavin-dependent oxidoreductase (nitroreductase family)
MTSANFTMSGQLGGSRSPVERDLASMLAASNYYRQANWPRRGLLRFAATRPGDWLFKNVLSRLDPPVYRLTKGRHTAANLLSGLPVVVLTTTGARTGLRRSVTVLGFPVEGGLAVIASNFGSAHDPSWSHNLRANPDAEVAVDGSTQLVHAAEAIGVNRDRTWCEGLRYFPGWAAYQDRAQGRAIAVFILVLQPLPDTSPHASVSLESSRRPLP